MTIIALLLFFGLVWFVSFDFHRAYFSYEAKRRRSPHLWDFSEVQFWKGMTKEEFLATYPRYPNGMLNKGLNGMIHTGFIVDFEEGSYKVLRISAITNSGFRSIAYNKKALYKQLNGWRKK